LVSGEALETEGRAVGGKVKKGEIAVIQRVLWKKSGWGSGCKSSGCSDREKRGRGLRKLKLWAGSTRKLRDGLATACWLAMWELRGGDKFGLVGVLKRSRRTKRKGIIRFEAGGVDGGGLQGKAFRARAFRRVECG